MLRIIQNSAGGSAKSYFTTSDYYAEGHQELAGIWRGVGAERLGLSGRIDQKDWDALCDNLNPHTGEPLTVRRKQDRSVGYDFNFHVPKSVSLLYALSQDDRILDAFRESVRETMGEMEAEAKTRVRQRGANEDRVTGNMIWGEHTHFTSRPVGGIPDPHLHCHAFVFNSTFDETENRWKAAQFRDLKRDAPYFEGRFHVRMARKMQDLGINVVRGKKSWEVAGFDKTTLDNFSRRSAQIDQKAKDLEKAARDAGNPMTVVKHDLGAQTRERKQKHLSMDDLRQEWRRRLSGEEQSELAIIARQIGGKAIDEHVRGADEPVRLAAEHCFERKSVVAERELLAEAMKRSVGHASLKAVDEAASRQKLIVAERKGRRFATTNAVLDEESRMLHFARSGRGTCLKLGTPGYSCKREHLNAGQRNAVRHVLESTDRVILVRGGAGVGKTTMMQAAVEAIQANGTKVFTFAPSAAASRGVLAREGFTDADTVARLLKDEKLQEQARESVLWIDEAGLLGTQATARLFELAQRIDARVVMCGDRRQHGAVERGAALRLLETEAGLIPAEIKEIQRQKGTYKEAVQALSEGRTEEGFSRLDTLGWIKTANQTDRYKALADEYVATVSRGESALVVSPTHSEGERITAEIRAKLQRTPKHGRKKNQYMLGAEQRSFRVLENAHLTMADRSDPVNFQPGDVIGFHQNASGIRKGERREVGKDSIPHKHADKFTVFHSKELALAQGDLIRITQNGQSADGHRLNNGATFTVEDFSKDGDIKLTNGWTIASDWGHWTHGFVCTSHGSQGSTVDRVFIAQSAESFPASSREQFYVSVSRARKQAVVYTDDKASLLEAVRHSDERLSATEFVSDRAYRERSLNLHRVIPPADRTPEPPPPSPSREDLMYER